MAELSALIKDYKKRLHTIGGDSFVELASRVVYRTAVDTGLLRRSWTPAINSFNNSNSGGNPASFARSYKLGDALTSTNGQPYVRRIEYTGHSPQVPQGQGMVTVSVAEFPAIVADQANRLRT